VSVVSVSTKLDAPADVVWETLQKTELLLYVMRPLLTVRGDLPKSWREAGQTVRIERLAFFGVVPLWEHEIRIVRFDDEKREALTEERGGPVTRWEHRIKVEPLSGVSCRYTDEILLEAGSLTPLVRLFAEIFYRHRQSRWRALARVLA
jgi:ligand-binding SRPBCC domain-containing protein